MKTKIHTLAKLLSIITILIILTTNPTLAVHIEEMADGTTVFSLTEEDKRQVEEEMMEKEKEREREEKSKKQKRLKTSVITFDTSSDDGCEKLKHYLKNLSQNNPNRKMLNNEELCSDDPNNSAISIFIVNDPEYNPSKQAYIQEELENIPRHHYALEDFLPEDEKFKNITTDTVHLSIIGGGIIAGIAMMPESISNWSDDKLGYTKNIKLGPHMDKDHWFVNFGLHPYSGALYYMVARHNGFSRLQSFGYSCLMSSFYWELGIEAYFEQPSWQDLIITPTTGSLLGLIFEESIKYIKNNNGMLFGSKRAGSVAMFIMDPINPTLDTSKGLAKYLSDHGLSLNIVLNEPLYSNEELQQMNSFDAEYLNDMTWTGVMVEYKTDAINDFFEYVAKKLKK